MEGREAESAGWGGAAGEQAREARFRIGKCARAQGMLYELRVVLGEETDALQRREDGGFPPRGASDGRGCDMRVLEAEGAVPALRML